MRILHAILATAVPALTLACATGHSSATGELSHAKAAISEAEGAGAQRVPKSALHLKMGRDQVARAERLIADDKDEDALLVLSRAEADARLALVLTHEADAQTEAQEAMARIEELREEAR